jgi:hypothetical protein
MPEEFSTWLEFFLSCKIPLQAAQQYDQKFTSEALDISQLGDINNKTVLKGTLYEVRGGLTSGNRLGRSDWSPASHPKIPPEVSGKPSSEVSAGKCAGHCLAVHHHLQLSLCLPESQRCSVAISFAAGAVRRRPSFVRMRLLLTSLFSSNALTATAPTVPHHNSDPPPLAPKVLPGVIVLGLTENLGGTSAARQQHGSLADAACCGAPEQQRTHRHWLPSRPCPACACW